MKPNLSSLADHFFGGWRINPILTLATGMPFTPETSFNRSRDLNSREADRPDLIPGRSDNPVLGGPDLYFDPSVFALTPAGFRGNLGRSTFRAPGVSNVDLGLVKAFVVSENVNVDFRTEVFNLLNRANFGTPRTNVFTGSGKIRGNVGVIEDTVTRSRQAQFALKRIF